MRYKLNSEIGKVSSPVRLIFPNGMKIDYHDGKSALSAEYDISYCIQSISAEHNMMVVTLKENDMINDTGWSKSEVSFF